MLNLYHGITAINYAHSIVCRASRATLTRIHNPQCDYLLFLAWVTMLSATVPLPLTSPSSLAVFLGLPLPPHSCALLSRIHLSLPSGRKGRKSNSTDSKFWYIGGTFLSKQECFLLFTYTWYSTFLTKYQRVQGTV